MNEFISDDKTLDSEDIANNADIALISDSIDSPAELHAAFHKYMKLSGRDRRFSDYYSVKLYGCTVPSMFFAVRDRFKAEAISSAPFTINETLLVSEPDLYYNKKAFDEGRINLCFVIGYSGSGKSVLTREYSGDNIERVELDDIVCVKDHYSLEGLKRNSQMMYEFFAGRGAKYYISRQERDSFAAHGDVFVDFIDFACEYAGSHPETKFILEGIWTYLFFGDPSRFEQYAVFIKGTSLMKSKLRRARRELTNKMESTVNRILEFGIYATDSMLHDSNVDKWRRHFEGMPDTILMEEETKAKVLRDSIMAQIISINACFVHNDSDGIRRILGSVQDSSDVDPREKAIITEDCKRALAELKA
ncbi:MAG: hypothetical protein IJ757_07005 [Clostridiales bacterium]|nr:hypothetical protein [Clostridiales bacterium]